MPPREFDRRGVSEGWLLDWLGRVKVFIPRPVRLRNRHAPALLLMLLVACSEARPWELVLRARPPAEGADGGPEPVVPWGRYAATLDIGGCVGSAPVMVVNTALDEPAVTGLDDPQQAGEHLSLREALWVASNRSGANTIVFDEAVFPAGLPATILMTAGGGLPASLSGTCIDARDRGVVLDWPIGAPIEMWGLGPGSLQVGLTFVHVGGEQHVLSARVAGCRYATDGFDDFGPSEGSSVLRADGAATIGPGNVFSAHTFIVLASVGATVRDNWFGVDAVTRRRVGTSALPTFQARAGSTVEHNVFTELRFSTAGFGGSGPIHLISNQVTGSAAARGEPTAAPPGIGISGLRAPASFVIGPGNSVSGHLVGILVEDALVTITQNSISANDAGIAFVGAAPPVPEILTASRTEAVYGGCTAAGTIELFADPHGQGLIYVDSTTCLAANQHWVRSADLSSSRFDGLEVTATLTDASGRTSGFSAPVPLP